MSVGDPPSPLSEGFGSELPEEPSLLGEEEEEEEVDDATRRLFGSGTSGVGMANAAPPRRSTLSEPRESEEVTMMALPTEAPRRSTLSEPRQEVSRGRSLPSAPMDLDWITGCEAARPSVETAPRPSAARKSARTSALSVTHLSAPVPRSQASCGQMRGSRPKGRALSESDDEGTGGAEVVFPTVPPLDDQYQTRISTSDIVWLSVPGVVSSTPQAEEGAAAPDRARPSVVRSPVVFMQPPDDSPAKPAPEPEDEESRPDVVPEVQVEPPREEKEESEPPVEFLDLPPEGDAGGEEEEDAPPAEDDAPPPAEDAPPPAEDGAAAEESSEEEESRPPSPVVRPLPAVQPPAEARCDEDEGEPVPSDAREARFGDCFGEAAVEDFNEAVARSEGGSGSLGRRLRVMLDTTAGFTTRGGEGRVSAAFTCAVLRHSKFPASVTLPGVLFGSEVKTRLRGTLLALRLVGLSKGRHACGGDPWSEEGLVKLAEAAGASCGALLEME
eukprot:Hpha_TRINITY_DN1297_c0_g1::TRINITY_DN1297_c0_g1_i1::g.44842::m.44842